MEKQKVVIVAEKVKLFAIVFIGVCFFSLGTIYFGEQSMYRVPRLLLPVYELFGNIGLAVGMLILGLAMVIYGYTIWKKNAGNVTLFGFLAITALIIGCTVAYISNNQPQKATITPEEYFAENEKERQKQINDIKETDEPQFDNPEIKKHFVAFDEILQKFKSNLSTGNKEAIQASENEYLEWSKKSAPLMESMDIDMKQEMAKYLAKLAIEWHDARTEVKN